MRPSINLLKHAKIDEELISVCGIFKERGNIAQHTTFKRYFSTTLLFIVEGHLYCHENYRDRKLFYQTNLMRRVFVFSWQDENFWQLEWWDVIYMWDRHHHICRKWFSRLYTSKRGKFVFILKLTLSIEYSIVLVKFESVDRSRQYWVRSTERMFFGCSAQKSQQREHCSIQIKVNIFLQK